MKIDGLKIAAWQGNMFVYTADGWNPAPVDIV